MMSHDGNEEAVSPVIGVILLVAITVILAATIAAYTFGMVGSVQKSYTVGVSARMNGSNIVVTYEGGPDQNSLDSSIPIKVLLNSESVSSFPTPVKIGDTITVLHTSSDLDHVVVVATFNGGAQTVILNTFI